MKYRISPLRLARLKKGFSQQGLSYLTGIPQVQISYAERGYQQALRPDQWERIAAVLEINLADLNSKDTAKRLGVQNG